MDDNTPATKADLKHLAAKDDLKNFATKDDLKRCAMKVDLKHLVTRDEFHFELNEIRKEMGDQTSDIKRHFDLTVETIRHPTSQETTTVR